MSRIESQNEEVRIRKSNLLLRNRYLISTFQFGNLLLPSTFYFPNLHFIVSFDFALSMATFDHVNDSLGSLSNDDDDGDKNGKETIGLDWQNNNSARASRFFVHFFAVVARLRRETA